MDELKDQVLSVDPASGTSRHEVVESATRVIRLLKLRLHAAKRKKTSQVDAGIAPLLGANQLAAPGPEAAPAQPAAQTSARKLVSLSAAHSSTPSYVQRMRMLKRGYPCTYTCACASPRSACSLRSASPLSRGAHFADRTLSLSHSLSSLPPFLPSTFSSFPRAPQIGLKCRVLHPPPRTGTTPRTTRHRRSRAPHSSIRSKGRARVSCNTTCVCTPAPTASSRHRAVWWRRRRGTS